MSGVGGRGMENSEFYSSMAPRDDSKEHVKSDHNILQIVANKVRRKVLLSWSVVIYVVLLRQSSFLIICFVLGYTNNVINN